MGFLSRLKRVGCHGSTLTLKASCNFTGPQSLPDPAPTYRELDALSA
jgi:hypothetical protein